MAHVRLSVGANLGNREAALQSVVDAMVGRFTGIRASGIYETAPWGILDQPAFLNAVIAADTGLSPLEVLEFARECERAADRVRERHWGPRTLDVDVITYDDLILRDPELTLPHPRAHERAFVLVPLVEVEPNAELPGLGRAADYLEVLGTRGIERHSSFRAVS